MQKVAIITLYDDANFGNKLQNFAVQTYFQSMGFCVTTVIDKLQTKSPKIDCDPIKILIRAVHVVIQHIGFEKEQTKRKKLLTLRKM